MSTKPDLHTGKTGRKWDSTFNRLLDPDVKLMKLGLQFWEELFCMEVVRSQWCLYTPYHTLPWDCPGHSLAQGLLCASLMLLSSSGSQRVWWALKSSLPHFIYSITYASDYSLVYQAHCIVEAHVEETWVRQLLQRCESFVFATLPFIFLFFFFLFPFKSH